MKKTVQLKIKDLKFQLLKMEQVHEINEECKECNHFNITGIIDSGPVCGFCIGLGHWDNAKKWIHIKDDACPFKGLSQYEAELKYLYG